MSLQKTSANTKSHECLQVGLWEHGCKEKRHTPSGLEAYAHMPDGKMHRKQRLIPKTPTIEYKWQWKHKLH